MSSLVCIFRIPFDGRTGLRGRSSRQASPLCPQDQGGTASVYWLCRPSKREVIGTPDSDEMMRSLFGQTGRQRRTFDAQGNRSRLRCPMQLSMCPTAMSLSRKRSRTTCTDNNGHGPTNRTYRQATDRKHRLHRISTEAGPTDRGVQHETPTKGERSAV